MKILFITNIISPYRVPLFNYLNTFSEHKIKVFFLAETAKHMRWHVDKKTIKFDYEILDGVNIFIPRMEWTVHLNKAVVKKLNSENPDVIVALGYGYPAVITALIWAKIKKRKFVFWSGSTLNSSKSKNFLIKLAKRKFISKCDAYVTYGTKATEYLLHYGAEEKKIITSSNTVDVNYWMKKCNELRSHERVLKLRKTFLPTNILFVGQLISRKGINTLLDAFRKVQDMHGMKETGLIIAGDGMKREQYQQYCLTCNIKNVFFVGYKQQEEIIDYFLVSDIFVLPSSNEVWGLVVNEAMACELPIVCSQKAGVTSDLIIDGYNGYVYDPSDVDSLANSLAKLIRDQNLQKTMAKGAIEKIKKFNIEKYGDDILSAINLAWKAN